MGQCSTLPAEARGSSSVAPPRQEGPFQRKDPMQEQRHRLREEGRKESLDFNRLVTPQQPATDSPSKQQAAKKTAVLHETKDYDNAQPAAMLPQTRDAERPVPSEEPDAMDVDPREEAPPPTAGIPPPPPKNATKIRAYKLNLDSNIIGLSSSQRQQICLGPFSEPPPHLTYSSSEDSVEEVNGTSVAIKTAQIFRGIQVSRDGTILSQNARATRSNRGNKTKRGEKSRQAAKIDKANDLVEEAVASGKSTDMDDAGNMVSVFIVGEYDDMKQLVRDGAKKLKDADGLPDEALLSINRPRIQKQKPIASKSLTSVLVSPRKRASPNFVNSQRTAAMQSPDTIHVAGISQSAPPRLKSHPRDTRPIRREERSGSRMRFDPSCNGMLDPRGPGGNGAVGDGDWSHAWNIWNCGGVGTVSPLQPSSPNETGRAPVFEGRDTTNGVMRDGGIGRRAN